MNRMTKIKNSLNKIRVLNKYGSYVCHIRKDKADMSVKTDKSVWIDSSTIQVLYNKKDETQLKHDAWKRDNYTCYLCGEVMHEGHPNLTVDHIKPKRLGGSILLENLGTCCRSCNEQKGYRTYHQYFWSLYQAITFVLLLRTGERRKTLVNQETCEKSKDSQ